MRVLVVCVVAVLAYAVRCQAALRHSDVCDTCTWGVKVSQAWLATPQASAFIVQMLQDNACSELPKDTQDQCRAILPLVVPSIIGLVETWQPKELCGDVGLCASAAMTPLQLKIAMTEALTENSNGVPCPLCKFAITTVKAQLSDPENQKAISNAAHQVCAAIPLPDLSANCTSIVDEKLPKIFALVEDLDPDGVCVDILHACPPVPPPGQIVSTRLQPRRLPPHLAKLSAKVQVVLDANLKSNCDTCKAVITEAASLLSNPDTQKEILDLAKESCDAFQAYKDQCVTYVELYGPLLFNMFVQYLRPELCTTIGYCTMHVQKFLPGATLMVS